MGKKLREKDYRTGYEQGFKDALKFALAAVNNEIDAYNKEVKMTKNTAVADFRAFILPGVIKWFGKADRVAIRTAWNDYTDSLCKSGQITLRQYETWTNPFN